MPTESEIDYRVIYSKRRKTLGIQVERDATVVVHAPEGTDPERIRSAVNAKRLWLYEKTRHPCKDREPAHPPGTELVSGESLLYLGRYYPIEIVDETGYAIRFEGRFIVPRARTASRDSVFREWLKARAHETILPRVRQRADLLGVVCNEVRITEDQYRWGSCAPDGDLSFNWRLIKAPLFVIDYVIVHELAHLIEPNHGSRFWAIVRTQIVGLDKARNWLKTHGALLDQKL